MNVKGHLLASLNPIFLQEDQSTASNDIQYLLISVTEMDHIKSLKNIINQYNANKSPEDCYSFPVAFTKSNAGLAAIIKIKLPAKSKDRLTRVITLQTTSSLYQEKLSMNPLFKTPLKDWLNKEFKISFSLRKYIFNQTTTTTDNSVELISGGSTQKLKGVSFHAVSIDLL